MRVTQFTFYNNFVLNQQNTLSDLTKVQTQIATGKKIENMQDDPAIFTEYLKLDEEINSFTQISSSANFALNFARESDTTLNDIVSTLTSFKTKLLDAANDTNDETSREAIVSELKGELEHLKDLANTSIDGKYIFSGSAFDTKPIGDDYTYQGNDKYVKAFLGAGVEREYNIPGSDLFLGRDNDYKKHVTFNVPQFDKMKANPEFVVRGPDGKLYIDKDIKYHAKEPDTQDPALNEPISVDSQIRMLTGVSDKAVYNTQVYKEVANSSFGWDGTLSDSVYDVLKTTTGINDAGDEVSFDFLVVSDSSGNYESISLSSSTTLDDVKTAVENLTGKCVHLYNGQFVDDDNNPVDVTFKAYNDTDNDNYFNPDHDDEIKTFYNISYEDGRSYFYLKGRKPSGESFTTKFDLSNSASVSDLLEKIGEAFGNTATSKVVDVTLNDMGQIQVTDAVSGKMVTDFYMVASDKDEPTFKDLVANGDYIVEFQKSGFNTIRDDSTITAANDYFDNRVFKFASDFKTLDGSRNALGIDLVKDVLGSTAIVEGTDTKSASVDFIRLTGTKVDGSSVDTYIKIDNDTKMNDLLAAIEDAYSVNKGDVSATLENGKIVITDNTLENKNDKSFLSVSMSTYTDTDGDGVFEVGDDEQVKAFRRSDFVNEDKAYLTQNGASLEGNVSQVIKDGYRTQYVYDKNGNFLEKREVKIDNPQHYATNDTRLADVAGYKEPEELDGKEFVVDFVDKDGNPQRAIITLRDTPYVDSNGREHYSTFWIDKNNDGVQDDDEIYDILHGDGAKTPANDKVTLSSELDPKTCQLCQKEELTKGITYQQLDDVVSLLVSGEYQNIDNSSDEAQYETTQQALEAAKSQVNVTLDEKGRLKVTDLTNSPTEMKVAIFDKDTDSTEDGVRPLLSFQANDAITIDQPQTDFFETLQQAIDAVANGNHYADADSADPRNFGIQGALEAIEHVMDRVRREHAQIGAVSNEFDMTIQRTDMLKVNVQTLQSDTIDTDIGEATMRLNSLNTTYQGLLASIAKINNLTLLNYLR